MKQYYMLIKNGFIDFKTIMIEKYHLLNLDETDAIILIKLNNCLLKNKTKLSHDELAPTMSISANTISKRIVELVKNGFITLTLSDVDASEVFSLDETYKRLGNLLESEDEQTLDNEVVNTTRKAVTLIEQKFKKVITPLELEVINHWVVDDKYNINEIEKAIDECVKLKKNSVRYVDLLLKPKETKINKVENLQELFNNVRNKSK